MALESTRCLKGHLLDASGEPCSKCQQSPGDVAPASAEEARTLVTPQPQPPPGRTARSLPHPPERPTDRVPTVAPSRPSPTPTPEGVPARAASPGTPKTRTASELAKPFAPTPRSQPRANSQEPKEERTVLVPLPDSSSESTRVVARPGQPPRARTRSSVSAAAADPEVSPVPSPPRPKAAPPLKKEPPPKEEPPKEPTAEAARPVWDLPAESWRQDAVSLAEGTTLGGYQLIKKIGGGAMGTVWLARQLSLDRNVAVKVLRPSLAGDPQFVFRFTQEALAAAQLIHHNIAQIHDCGSEGQVHFFSMEYVDDGSLASLVQRQGRRGSGGGRRLHPPGGARAEVRPRTGHGAPGHQAGQPAAQPQRRGEGGGPGPGEARRELHPARVARPGDIPR